MKCPLCEQRKGKRSCPAKNALICAQCCGEKRILEIDCPETCEYLKIGRGHEAQVHRMRHFHSSDPVLSEKRHRVISEYEDVLAAIEFFLADERHSNRNLNDREVAEATDLLLATLHTQQKGIIYESTSSDLAVESLRRRFMAVADSYLNPREEGRRRLRVSEMIEILEVVRSFLARHLEAGAASLSYVDFLARLLPRSGRITDSGSSIIIPGRG